MNIRYAQVTAAGQLSFADSGAPWLDDIVGPEGWARVPLPNRWRMAAFVNDCGLLSPETYPRNIIGSCLACSFGAKPYPLAGTVVFTGWDPSATERDEIEARPLTTQQEEYLSRCHGDIRRALGLDPDPLDPARHPLARWNAKVREFAEFVKTTQTPGWTILTGDDALAHLRTKRDGA